MAGVAIPRTHTPHRGRPLARRLLSLLAPWSGKVAVIGVLVLAAAVCESVPPLILRNIIDAHLAVGNAHGLLIDAVLYLGALAAMQGLTFAYGYLAATVAQAVLRDLRIRLFAHVQRLPTTYFDHTPLGDIISRCTADVDTLDTVFSSDVTLLVASLARLVTISATMFVLSPALSLVAALIAPLLLLISRFLQVRVRQAERDHRIAVGAVNARLYENLRSAEVIRAFGREPAFVAGFRQVLRAGLAASNRSSFYSAFYIPTTAILAAIAVAALLLAGTGQPFGDLGISLGTLTAFLVLLQRFFQPITALGEEWQTVQGAMAGAERIFDTLALEPDSELDVAGREHHANEPSIVLHNVEFGYAEGHPVLHGVSLEVQPGEHLALVGRTGAGKTSALHLLAGLYRPWAGSVAIAGRDPATLHETERSEVLGVVPQVVQVFSGTVMDNLRLHDDSISLDAVYRAARIAGADAFIRQLPRGYETLLSASGSGRGAHLSAGQQQLLALARALVRRPAVLLLDEATAAIDNASDAAFRAALREHVLPYGCAVLTVAHRISTAIEADRVVLLHKGRIAEEGTPAELLARKGRFAALLELEAAGWDWRNSA